MLLVALFLNSSIFCAKKKKSSAGNNSGNSSQSTTGSETTDKKSKKTTTTESESEQKPVENQQESKVETDNTITDTKTAKTVESINLPTQKRTFFSKIDPEIVSGVENGAPDSLKQAMSKLRKNESEYEENEKVLIAVAAEMMKTVWPSEKITWEVFSVSEENSYIGAINSANKGVFDSSTGNSDFLLTLLPSLVLLKPTFTADVIEPCELALKNSLERNSNSVIANYLMGELLSKKKEDVKAEAFYKKAYESSSNTKEIILAYSTCLRKNGNLTLAYEVLSSVEVSSDLNVLKQNAYLAFAKKDLGAAEEYVARVLQQNPNDLEFLLFRAKILIEKKDYIHAVSLLDMYARQESSSLDYLLLRAKVQLDWSKNTTAATETIEKALSLYPENEEVIMEAAKIASATDSKVGGLYADEFAVKLLEKNENNLDAMNYALSGLIQRQNWLDAYSVCNKIIQQSSGKTDADLVMNYVTICINLSKNTEAYEYSKRMKELNPDNEQILQTYIFAYSQNGSSEEVIKYIDSLMPGASSKLKSYLYYRKSFLQTSEEGVLADLRSSLISNPRNSDSLFRLYEIYFSKKDYRKAQYYLRQVVAINPNDASAKKLNEELSSLIAQ